jgi:hypothetical protein
MLFLADVTFNQSGAFLASRMQRTREVKAWRTN